MVSFVSVALLIQFFIPAPSHLPVDGRSERLELLKFWSKDANVGVFGTSRINESVDPRLLDAGLSKINNHLKSLNLSLYGGSQTEQRFLASAFLDMSAHTGTKACLVILELNAGLNFPPENRFHPRAINLYDRETLDFVYHFSGEGLNLFRRIGRMAFALLAGAAHYMNMGMISTIVFPPPPLTLKEVERRGLVVHPVSEPYEIQRVHALFERRPEHPQVGDFPLQPGHHHLVDWLNNRAVSNGITPPKFIYVLTPTLADMETTQETPEYMTTSAGEVPIINMARPARFPELYQQKNWRNAGHLSEAGSKVFSHLLAQQITAWLKAHPQALACGF